MAIEAFIQVGIVICSGASALLLSRNDGSRRWGFLASIVGQPLWLYTSITHKQWGIALLALYFAACGFRGLWTHRHYFARTN